MRHQANARRMRGRTNNHNSGQGHNGQRRGYQNNKNRVFDSNGPDVRIRGTAFQIVEKYMTLAKDAQSSGDRVMAESYLQHAEHYQRMVNVWAEEAMEAGDYSSETESSNSYEEFSVQRSNVAPELKAIEGGAEDLGLPSSLIAPRKTELAEA